MSKQYRIKTEAEFIEEFGEDWKTLTAIFYLEKEGILLKYGSAIENQDLMIVSTPDRSTGFMAYHKNKCFFFSEILMTDKPLPEESVKAESVSEQPSILTEAEDIVNGARATDYGSAKESFERISKLANLMFNKEEREMMHVFRDITPSMVVKVLMAVKIARESNKHKRDNLVDLCGYAELLNRVEG